MASSNYNVVYLVVVALEIDVYGEMGENCVEPKRAICQKMDVSKRRSSPNVKAVDSDGKVEQVSFIMAIAINVVQHGVALACINWYSAMARNHYDELSKTV